VKEVLGNDDVGAMEEVVRRRLNYWPTSKAPPSSRRADLIIVDGGLPQCTPPRRRPPPWPPGPGRVSRRSPSGEELLYDRVRVCRSRWSAARSRSIWSSGVRDEAHRFASPSIAPNAASPWSPPRSRASRVWAPRGVNACSAPSAHSTRCVRRRSNELEGARVAARRRGAKALRSSAGASQPNPTKGSDE